MVVMLLFKMGTKFSYRHVFTAINILCKFSEDIFITECDIKLDLTRGSEMPQKAGCAGNIDGQTNRQKMDKRRDGSTPMSVAT